MTRPPRPLRRRRRHRMPRGSRRLLRQRRQVAWPLLQAAVKAPCRCYRCLRWRTWALLRHLCCHRAAACAPWCCRSWQHWLARRHAGRSTLPLMPRRAAARRRRRLPVWPRGVRWWSTWQPASTRPRLPPRSCAAAASRATWWCRSRRRRQPLLPAARLRWQLRPLHARPWSVQQGCPRRHCRRQRCRAVLPAPRVAASSVPAEAVEVAVAVAVVM